MVLLRLYGQEGPNMSFLDTIHTVGKKPSIFGERKRNQSIKTGSSFMHLQAWQYPDGKFFFFLHGIGSFCIKGLFLARFGVFVIEIRLSQGFSSFCSSLVFMFVYVGREYLCVGVSVHVCVCGGCLYMWLCTHPAFKKSRSYPSGKRAETKCENDEIVFLCVDLKCEPIYWWSGLEKIKEMAKENNDIINCIQIF